MRNRALIVAAVMALRVCARADDALRAGPQRYTPPSRSFVCELPSDWIPYEENDGFGGSVHVLGPEDPKGVYRPGLDIRWSEKGDASFVPFKQQLEEMRRPDERTGRSASPIRVLRLSGTMVRTFEITETKRLPEDRWPSLPVELHRFVAIVPSGESYFTLTLSSTRDTYMDYRDTFLDFLKNFRAMGYK